VRGGRGLPHARPDRHRRRAHALLIASREGGRAPALATFSMNTRRLPIVLLALAAAFFCAASPDPEYAKNYRLEDFPTHKLLTIDNVWVGSGDLSFQYALVPKGAPLPELPAGAAVIRTPVERVVAMATVYLGPIQALDAHDALIGL